MMHEKRLLERIRDYEKDKDRRAGIDPRALTTSVLSHLRRMLNTKQGSSPIAEDYGLADITDMPGAFAEADLERIEGKVVEVIKKYEPRIADVNVHFATVQDDTLSLRFEIRGRINDESLKTPVVFESVVQSNGKISITG